MLFSSLSFIFGFLPAFMVVYLLVPERYRNIVLLMGSLVFYALGEPCYVVILILSLIINYFIYTKQCGCGTNIRNIKSKVNNTTSKTREKYIYKEIAAMNHKRTVWFVLSVIVDTAVLFIFKYWDFFADNINCLTGNNSVSRLSIALPLGISFYTFQIISFQIDCFRREQDEKVDFVKFATYVCMFPQLIAGPIVKYEEVGDKLEKRKITADNIEMGLRLFAVGLAVKVLLANQIGTLWNSILEAGADSLSTPSAWLGAAAYSFQIYFDFWGYSLMAMGLGEMLGFDIPVNFMNPYAARSISEYWRRWHITLGRWFREYIYIPMGGSRKGFGRTVFNTFIVWTLTGLWHGANWSFVIWGLIFFVLISFEKIKVGGITIAKRLEGSKIIGHLAVIIIIPVTWVVFAQTDMGAIRSYLLSMAGIHGTQQLTPISQVYRQLTQYAGLLSVCVIFATPYPMMLYKKYCRKWYMGFATLGFFWFAVYEIWMGSNNPFLYFRF